MVLWLTSTRWLCVSYVALLWFWMRTLLLPHVRPQGKEKKRQSRLPEHRQRWWRNLCTRGSWWIGFRRGWWWRCKNRKIERRSNWSRNISTGGAGWAPVSGGVWKNALAQRAVKKSKCNRAATCGRKISNRTTRKGNSKPLQKWSKRGRLRATKTGISDTWRLLLHLNQDHEQGQIKGWSGKGDIL